MLRSYLITHLILGQPGHSFEQVRLFPRLQELNFFEWFWFFQRHFWSGFYFKEVFICFFHGIDFLLKYLRLGLDEFYFYCWLLVFLFLGFCFHFCFLKLYGCWFCLLFYLLNIYLSFYIRSYFLICL